MMVAGDVLVIYVISYIGRNLPFYEIPADYVSDEINEVDIAFVLWKLNSNDDDEAVIANPF